MIEHRIVTNVVDPAFISIEDGVCRVTEGHWPVVDIGSTNSTITVIAATECDLPIGAEHVYITWPDEHGVSHVVVSNTYESFGFTSLGQIGKYADELAWFDGTTWHYKHLVTE